MKTLHVAALILLFIIFILTVHTAPSLRSKPVRSCPGCIDRKAPEQNSRAKHQVSYENEIYMDEYLKSIDDEFKKCKAKMYRLVKSKYLMLELNSNENFRIAWQDAKEHFGLNGVPESKLTNDDLKKIALNVYTGDEVYGQLNGKMRKGRDDYKTEKFGLISLQFLITDAIQALNPRGKCQTTYRFSQYNFAIPGMFVRFGSFASSTRKSTLSTFGRQTCFIIYTCYGADISKESVNPNEEEVLIPPYERFIKETQPPEDIQMDLADCGRIHRLRSAGKKSNMKCELFKWKRTEG